MGRPWKPGEALIAKPNGPTGSISPQSAAAQDDDED